MERQAFFIEQNNQILAKHIKIPLYSVGISEVDTDSISDELLQIFTCNQCFTFVINPRSCKECHKFICNQCQDPDSACPSCKTPTKIISKQDQQIYDQIRFLHKCTPKDNLIKYDMKGLMNHLSLECPKFAFKCLSCEKSGFPSYIGVVDHLKTNCPK